MPKPFPTKSNNEPNWLMMMLWCSVMPCASAAKSNALRSPYSGGIEMSCSPTNLLMPTVFDVHSGCALGRTR